MATWSLETPTDPEIQDRAVTLVRSGKRGTQKIDIRIYELPYLVEALLHFTKDVVCSACEEKNSCEDKKIMDKGNAKEGGLN